MKINMENNKRFKLFAQSQYIKDDLTGKLYSRLNEITKLLNETSDKSDKLAEELYHFRLLLMDFGFKDADELRKALEMKIIIQSNVQDYCDVLRKYEIDSPEKLDQVLFNQRVW